ncbi:indolepyruvate ferredoxin oxidoreductase subunit alpha [bacterium]|nr:indolepyruvate ferredoxin oxidoreductase subunit alpha [bacterium]
MFKISCDSYEGEVLLQGNQAIARGALEAGVLFCTGYPGNPSSEIIETLAKASEDLPIYVEWSINEKVAFESATAASFAGCRGISCMKQNGVNVISDFLTNLTLSGTNGGLVLVVCDDPAGISSTNEEDSRMFSKLAGIPLLEPSTPQEALEMTKWAFELSESILNVVMVRSVSRLSHSRSNVSVGKLGDFKNDARFDTNIAYHTFPVIQKHQVRNEKLKKALKINNESHFNFYKGPEIPELLIVTSGCSYLYSMEALKILELESKVGLLKLGTTHPLPEELIRKHLISAENILFAEEIDAFIEDSVKALASDLIDVIGVKRFFGKASGHIPTCGELSPTVLISLLADIFNLEYGKEVKTEPENALDAALIPREFGFCPGCPHRASYYAIQMALKLDGRNGFVSGDIGCYTLGIWPSGFNQVKSVHAMGSGLGLANGYGKLTQFGFNQPVITVCGDSTFFHAGLPPLLNAKFNQSDIFLIILDNSATAMTGFQPHPGSDCTLMGVKTDPINIERICQSIDIDVITVDPYDFKLSIHTILSLLEKSGPKVLILKRNCALVQNKKGGFEYKISVDNDRCLSDSCGCNQYCTRIFRCPGLIWDSDEGNVKIDEVLCVGCGICSQVCPQNAIKKSIL